MQDKTFTMQDLINFVVGWEYSISFDDALEFVKSFARTRYIEIDEAEIRELWANRHRFKMESTR